jgi:signal recognition particle GTPase
VTKFDGTIKGGMVVAIQKELGIPIKFVGLGEKADDLQPFNPKQFAQAFPMIQPEQLVGGKWAGRHRFI